MNERIRELADATAELMPSGVYNTEYESGKKGVEFTEDALEKFAELIVKECADIGSKLSLAHPEAIRYQIKKHFGVRE